MVAIDYTKLVPIDEMRGEDAEDTTRLKGLFIAAKKFLSSFDWCEGVKNAYFGDGVGNLVGVFLFEIIPTSAKIDNFLWVVVGDIPPAYLVTDQSPTPKLALVTYMSEMHKWVEAVRKNRSVEDLIPVNAKPTIANADDLESRLRFIEEEIVHKPR